MWSDYRYNTCVILEKINYFEFWRKNVPRKLEATTGNQFAPVYNNIFVITIFLYMSKRSFITNLYRKPTNKHQYCEKMLCRPSYVKRANSKCFDKRWRDEILHGILTRFSREATFLARSDFFFCLLSSRLELIKNLFNFD